MGILAMENTLYTWIDACFVCSGAISLETYEDVHICNFYDVM